MRQIIIAAVITFVALTLTGCSKEDNSTPEDCGCYLVSRTPTILRDGITPATQTTVKETDFSYRKCPVGEQIYTQATTWTDGFVNNHRVLWTYSLHCGNTMNIR